MSKVMFQAPSADPRFVHIPPKRVVHIRNATADRLRDAFDRTGRTVHRPEASTLQIVLDHCHSRGIAYFLRCKAGQGYHVERFRLTGAHRSRDFSATDGAPSLVQDAEANGEDYNVLFLPGTGTVFIPDKSLNDALGGDEETHGLPRLR